jgi:hypothetical protein
MRSRNGNGLRRRALRRQRDVLCDVMLAAGLCGTWLTLHELAQLTRYGEASISAQLRHLRKPQYGGYVVEKRRRRVEEVTRGEELGVVWEYRMKRQVRIGSWLKRKRAQRSSPLRALSAAV